MKRDLPEFVTGVVIARHADGHVVEMDLGPGEWRPKNLHPNGYQIDHFELGDEPGENGQFEVIVVLTGLRF